VTLATADITTLYDARAEGLLLFATRRTFDAQHAVDLLGETFAAAFARREAFENGSVDAEIWLDAIAVERLNRFYNTGSLELCELTGLGVERVKLGPGQVEAIEDAAGLDALRSKVHECLDLLSLESRTAVRLRICDQLSFAAMTEKLEIDTAEAVRRVCRGMSVICASLDLTGPWKDDEPGARAAALDELGDRLAESFPAAL
jgi:RNA polymerase sigma-70 factor (ECF subfamily)